MPLLSSCAPGAEATALCALESAGAWALGLSGAALLAGVLLGAATATQEVHRRGNLGPLAECLTIPAATFERAMLLAPPLLWGLLLFLVFLTLLVYAARVSPVLPAAALPAAAALAAAALPRSLPLPPFRLRRCAGALQRARHGAARPLVRLRPPRTAARCGGRGAARRLPTRRRPGRGEAWLRLRLRLMRRLRVGWAQPKPASTHGIAQDQMSRPPPLPQPFCLFTPLSPLSPSALVLNYPLPPPPPPQIIDALDTLVSSWCHLARVQRACLVALLGGAACELLLWVQRDGWCWLLLLFGARAVARRARGQLAAYQCAAVLAACTDVLALASATDGLCVVLRWLTLLSKLASVGLLALYPTAFS